MRSPKVSQDLGGVRRSIADIVEDLADPPVRARDDRDPVEQALTARHERRKANRARETEFGVTQESKWQVEPSHKLLLIRGCLGTDPEDLNA